MVMCFFPLRRYSRAVKYSCSKSFAVFLFESWLTQLHLTDLAFSATLAAKSPRLHVAIISATWNPVIGLGSPLLRRNTRTQRNWSPETFYQKPASPGGRSCCSSHKYTYIACPIFYSSHVGFCHCSCASVLSSALQSHIHFYLSS